MWKVDAMVDATGRSPVADRILQHWEHDAGSARFFRSSANFLYTFDQKGKRHFLRFADSSERSREEIEAEVDLVNWLAGAGIDVAIPIRAKDEHFVQSTETERGTFHAVVFGELQGSQFEIDELDSSRFHAWGGALGKLHAALKHYPGTATPARRSWQDDLEMIGGYMPVDAPALRNEWEWISASLSELPVEPDNYGLIHFDFELDNLVWGNQSVGILDFDDCARYWTVADVAFALRDLFGDNPNLDDGSFREFVSGYRAYCPLDEETILKIPLFLRMAKLIQYARMARSLDLAQDQKYPDWLLSLSQKLQQRMKAYREALVERGV